MKKLALTMCLLLCASSAYAQAFGKAKIRSVGQFSAGLCAANEILTKNAGNTGWECATEGAGSGDITSVGDDLTGPVPFHTITLGDGSAGDMVWTFDGDAGNDGTLTWDVSEDAFQFNNSLYIDSNDVVSFDGSTADVNRGNLTTADVQATRTWTLPDATGTIPVFTPTPTDQHCVRWEVDGSSNVTLGTTGATCASSGGNVTGTGTSVLNAVPVYADTGGLDIVVATNGEEMTIDPANGNAVINGNLTVTGILSSTSAGQAILDEGLIVNNDQAGTDADNDFIVYGDTLTAINVDASADTVAAGGTWTFSNLGMEFTESDTNPTCAAGDYSLFADLSETALKKCENGSVTVIGTGAFDATAQDALTWSDGANASNAWTMDVSGTDVVVTWGSAATTITGVVTTDGLTMGANENLTLGGQTLDHDGTNFVFDDSLSVATSGDSSVAFGNTVTADPCGTGTAALDTGALYYSSAGYFCYCDSTATSVDLKVSDNAACAY